MNGASCEPMKVVFLYGRLRGVVSVLGVGVASVPRVRIRSVRVRVRVRVRFGSILV